MHMGFCQWLEKALGEMLLDAVEWELWLVARKVWKLGVKQAVQLVDQ